MKKNDVYIDLDGQEISLGQLDEAERKLVSQLQKQASKDPDWCSFDNFWMTKLGQFYEARRMPRKLAVKTPVFQIALDLSSRLAVASGLARAPDYLDELAELIRSRYKTRRAFCEATGLAESAVDRLLAGRPTISLKTLTEALERIGCTLHIAPTPRRKRTG